MKSSRKYWFSKNELGALGGGKGILITENKSFTLSTLLDESICYLAIGGTNANATMTDGDKAPTMLARAGTGGGNEPIVLMRKEHGTDRV